MLSYFIAETFHLFWVCAKIPKPLGFVEKKGGKGQELCV